MELTEAMSNLRAVRRLRPDPIPDDVMQRILRAATWAPSGGNAEPWRVVVVTDPEKKSALAGLYRPAWERYVAATWTPRMADMPEDAQASLQKMLKAGNYLAAHMDEAPALLVFCFDPQRMAFTDRDQDRLSVAGGGSLYPAVQNLMLACVAEGLGCTLTTLHCQAEPAVKQILGIPEQWGTSALVPIGYPVGRGHGPITRRPVEQMAYRDEFGTRWTAGSAG